jgi:hypothetical protein
VEDNGAIEAALVVCLTQMIVYGISAQAGFVTGHGLSRADKGCKIDAGFSP